MQAFACLVILTTLLLCDGFIISSFRNGGFGRRPSLPVLKPQQLTRGRPQTSAGAPLWLASGSRGFNASALVGLSATVAHGNAHAFVQQLQALADSRIGQTLPRPEAESLIELIGSMVERIIHPRDVADFMSSLGKLGFQASIPQQRALIVKSVQQLCRTKGISGVGLWLCLEGLTRTGLKFSDLSAELRDGVMQVIEQAAQRLDPRDPANVLKGLAKLEETWSSFPLSSQRALLKSFDTNAHLMNSRDAATAVHSFGQLRLSSQSLTDEQRQMIFKVAMKGIGKESAPRSDRVWQDISMTTYGLAQMGFARSELPSELRKGMESCLLHSLAGMDGRGVSTVIHAFGHMKYSWLIVGTALQAAFQQASVNMLVTAKLQDFSMTLLGLADMGAKWGSLMPELRKKIEQAVISMVHRSVRQEKGDAQAVVNVFHSLGKMMDAPWRSLSPAFHAAVSDTFILLQNKFTPQDISNFIYGLGCMGAPFQDLSPTFMTAVQKAVHRLSGAADSFKPQEISNTLLGFANMGASWDQLPAKELEHLLVRLAPSMNAQDVSNSMHGLTLLCFDFKPTSVGSELEKGQLMWRMIRALAQRFRLLGQDEYGKQDITQFAIFFEWLSGLPGGMELITEELGSRPAFVNPDGMDAPTALHLDLSQALPTALLQLQPAGQFHIVNEFDGLGGHVFAIDMAVHQDGKLIAFVEVDSSYHYTADGKQLKRTDLLKEALYAQRYPLVALHRVRNEQLFPSKIAGMCVVLAEAILKQCKVALEVRK